MDIDRKADKLETPVCPRCGNEMTPTITEAVYHDGQNIPVRGGGLQTFVPIAHRHCFQCEQCTPPRAVIEVPYTAERDYCVWSNNHEPKRDTNENS